MINEKMAKPQVQCLPNNELQSSINEASIDIICKVLQILVNHKAIPKETRKNLQSVSKPFLWTVRGASCKFSDEDIVNYRLIPSLMDAKLLKCPLDFLSYMWGQRVKAIRIYYNIGDNRFKEEVEIIRALWGMNCLPYLDTLTIEIASTPYIKKEETLYPEEAAGLFSLFKKVIFSHRYSPLQTIACHRLAIELFLPSLTQVESVVLSIHPGNAPDVIPEGEREELKASYMERSASLVEHCLKLNLAVDFDLEGKLGKPWLHEMMSWIRDMMVLKNFEERVLKGDWNLLPKEDRQFLSDFVAKREILHLKIADSKSVEFVKILVLAGFNINTVDLKGRTILELCDNPELFLWLWNRGARLGENHSVINFIIQKHTLQLNTNQCWVNILLQFIPNLPLSDFRLLTDVSVRSLARLAKENPVFADSFQDISKKITIECPEMIISIGCKLLTSGNFELHSEDFLQLRKNGVLTDQIIEGILVHPDFLYWNLRNDSFFLNTDQIIEGILVHPDFLYWNLRNDSFFLNLDRSNILKTMNGPLKAFYEQVKEVRLAVFCYGLLQTTKLEQAARILSQIDAIGILLDQLDAGVKEKCINHIQILQDKEKTTVWHFIYGVFFNAKQLCLLETFGLDPNWTDCHHRTLLFTELGRKLKVEELTTSKINIAHLDSQGENALEYHCRNPDKYGSNIKALCEIGLRPSQEFPYAKQAASLLPDEPFLQAILVTCLLHPDKQFIHSFIRDLGNEKLKILQEAIQKDDHILARIGKKIDPFPKNKRGFSKERIDLREKFDSSAQRTLNPIVKKNRWADRTLTLYASFWEGKVPTSCLEIIPESPMASLAISVIQQVHSLNSKHLRPIDLFDNFDHDDMVYFNRYLFDHPEFFKILLKNYFKLKQVTIQSQGFSRASHVNFVESLIRRMKELLHIKNCSYDLPDWHKRIIDSFNKIIAPIPKETFEISEEVPISLVGRTVVVKRAEHDHAFKFLKKDESYKVFSQELIMTEAFNLIGEQFKSHFHKPIGIYMIKHLPSVLTQYQDVLGKGPFYVYHHEAKSEIFEHLQELSIQKFQENRLCTLHDAAKMIKLGICPDFAALFRNDPQKGHYTFLLDLASRFSSSQFADVNAKRGAGQLDRPFEKLRHLNTKATGLMDLGNAQLIKDGAFGFYSLSVEEKTKYFYQMETLSIALLVDMLLLAERHQKSGALNWKNEEFLQTFGRELAEGFACVASAYAEKPFETYLHFALECGIEWTRMARQIAFWVDNSENGYPAWIAQGKVPSDLYEEGVEISVNANEATNFDPIQGFRTDNHQDIGVFKGPLALTEFEKSMYLLFVPIALAEPLSPPKPEREYFGFYLQEHF